MSRNGLFFVGIVSLLLAGCAGAGASARPGDRIADHSAPVPTEEHEAVIAAMRPPKRARPVIAVVGQNEGTETTDFLLPYAVLAASGAADVIAVSPGAGPMTLTPALTIEPQGTFATFDARFPEGADYVVVPKLQDPGHAPVVAWIRAQAATGAMIVGICSGAKTLSAAGFLRDRSATGHWYDIKGLLADNPTMRWVRNRRYVVDRGVMTTTGVSASLPASLALVEAFAGRARAAELSQELGAEGWDERHESGAFSAGFGTFLTVTGGHVAFWVRETFGVPVTHGVDEISLAFTADAWSRTIHSRALAIAPAAGPVHTRRGLRLLPDAVSGGVALTSRMPPPTPVEPARALPASLDGIAARYGRETAAYVALQLEYPWPPRE